ncbi:MAG: MFS transporter [Clostridium sp.]|nr:MFS transporter [Clostridium sp.]
MFSMLLAIIYLAFISLGLPDSLLGSAWPVMRGELGVPVSYAGTVSMIIAGGTILSSLMSDRLTRKLGPGPVTAASTALTAVALLGFSMAGSFAPLCLFAVPYGLGAGAIDAALNNYVALHYRSRHMNWLHCFWGVGAAVSPYIMSACLTGDFGWRGGYRTVAGIQLVLAAALFASLPLWNKRTGTEKTAAHRAGKVWKIKGAKYILIAFFGYCALETTAGLWATSYLVAERGIAAETAAGYASLFYLGITGGRFVCGFVSDRIGDRNMIRLGLAVIAAGTASLWLPWSGAALPGLVVAGLGCAPIYPSIIHSTPANFGAENSQSIVGVQMASAYTGSTFVPPLFGIIANHISLAPYPAFLFFFAVLMFLMTEALNRLQTR